MSAFDHFASGTPRCAEGGSADEFGRDSHRDRRGGQITRTRHFPGFPAIPGVRIVGVCNRRRESARRVAREFDIPKVYGNWEDLVADPDVDAVVIGAWPYLHCPVTLAAFDAGKHVLTQARMAMNAREAQRMHDRRPESPRSDRDDRPQPLRPDRRRLHALADRLGLSGHAPRGPRPFAQRSARRPGNAP